MLSVNNFSVKFLTEVRPSILSPVKLIALYGRGRSQKLNFGVVQ